MVNGGKARAVLVVRIRGRGRYAVAQRIDGDQEEFRRIDHLVRADEVGDVGAVAGKPGGEQDGVGLLRVQRAPGAVADEAIVDLAAVGQFARVELGDLLIAVGRSSPPGR